MLKHDPSQNKTVVILLVILVIAGVATVARIHPAGQVKAVARTDNAAVQVSADKKVVMPEFEPSRNPFFKPSAVKTNKDFDIPNEVKTVEVPPLQPPGDIRVEAIDSNSGQKKESPAASTQPDVNKSETSRPTFTLLAIIGNCSGLSAVIRTNESNTRVVEVGDMVDGGYKVQKLEADRAVLTDGRDIIVVKRPQS